MGKFADQIEQFSRKVHAKYRAVAREAAQETISIAQRTRGEGGRMRVDTGFLRASVQAAINVVPRGPTTNPDNVDFRGLDQAAGAPIATVLLRWDVTKGQKLFVGWTANYAPYREAKDGYLRGAIERWDQTVHMAAKKAEALG